MAPWTGCNYGRAACSGRPPPGNCSRATVARDSSGFRVMRSRTEPIAWDRTTSPIPSECPPQPTNGMNLTPAFVLPRELISRMFSKREFGSRQGRMASSFKETMDPAVAQSALLRAYEQANGDHGSNRYGELYILLAVYLLPIWICWLAYNCVP